MTDIGDKDTKVSRRAIFELGSAALAAATLTVAAAEGCGRAAESATGTHNAPNETDPGPQNLPLAEENPDSVWPPPTDHGRLSHLNIPSLCRTSVSRAVDGHGR